MYGKSAIRYETKTIGPAGGKIERQKEEIIKSSTEGIANETKSIKRIVEQKNSKQKAKQEMIYFLF